MDLYPHHLASWSRSKLELAIRRRVQVAYLGNELVLARILGRHKMFLDSSDRGLACHLMLDGFWEMWLTQFLARQVKPGMNVVDIGAHFGYYTLLLGDAVGNNGHVTAIEPHPTSARLLKESVSLNGYAGRTSIINHALGSSNGTAWLYSPDNEPKNASIVDSPDLPGGTTFAVSTIALDDVAHSGPPIDLVKIDAEGAEVSIVQGMQRTIARDKPRMVLEFNPGRYAEPKRFLNELLSTYGTAQQLSFDGTIKPLDEVAVLDLEDREDRILLFGFVH